MSKLPRFKSESFRSRRAMLKAWDRRGKRIAARKAAKNGGAS